jgi:outer membrane receptor for ferrienterochelin and colicins
MVKKSRDFFGKKGSFFLDIQFSNPYTLLRNTVNHLSKEGGDMTDRKRALKCCMCLLGIFILIFPFTGVAQDESTIDAAEKSEKQKKIDRLFKMSLEELMDVRITTAGKTSQRIGDIPASVVLITREDIETYGYRTLTEILQNVPGLFGIDDLEYFGLNLGVRGFSSQVPNRNMMILVDGVSQMNDLSFNFPFRTLSIPVEAIDRIEVIRGPMSVIYGNGAFFGVINIFTRDISEGNKPMNIVSGSLGTYNTSNLTLRISGKNDNTHFAFNASLRNSDGLNHDLEKMTSDVNSLPSHNTSTDGNLEFNEKYFNFSLGYKDFYLNFNYNDNKKEFLSFLPTFGTGTYVQNNRVQAAVGYKKDLSETFSIDGSASYTFNRDYFNYDHLRENFYGIQKLETNSLQMDFNVFYNPNNDLEFTGGISYRSIFDANNMYDLPSFGATFLENNFIYLFDGDNIETRAVFGQLTYRPFKKLSIILGTRLEESPKYRLGHRRISGSETTLDLKGKYDQEKVEVIPRVAAIFYLNKNNIFKFLYGEAIRRPSFDQNRQNSLNPLRPDLEPENIQTLEINYIASFSQRFNLNFSIFKNTLENLITRIVEHDQQGNYETWSGNAAKMVTYGAELTLNAEPIEYLRMELSGTYQKTEDKLPNFENIEVANSPKLLGYLKASYLGVGFKIAVTGTYVGSMESFWDETKNNPLGLPGGGSRIGDKVGGYFVIGANLRFDDLLIDGLFLNIRCSNILDEEIRYPTTTLSEWLDKGTLDIGRTFLVSLGYKF